MLFQLPSVREHANQYHLVPKKSLGQNFIFDLNVCVKIAKVAGVLEGSTVLEVGSGTCGLTRAILAQNPKCLIAIEKDTRSFPMLQDLCRYYTNLVPYNMDALQMPLNKISSDKLTIIANLPYFISTKLLINWLFELNQVNMMVLMMQKELVDRICAHYGGREYGRLSVMLQAVAKVKKEFGVPRECFYPKPKVDSAIISVTPTMPLEPNKLSKLERVVKVAFSARRKKLKNNLDKEFINTSEVLRSLCIGQDARAEEIKVNDYLYLSENLIAFV